MTIDSKSLSTAPPSPLGSGTGALPGKELNVAEGKEEGKDDVAGKDEGAGGIFLIFSLSILSVSWTSLNFRGALSKPFSFCIQT